MIQSMRLFIVLILASFALGSPTLAQEPDATQATASALPVQQPYIIDTGIESRSISFENPTGERGAGAQAASPLGVGRKGSPSRVFAPGETVELANIEGPGQIRHIWMTMAQRPQVMRSVVVRVYWDGQNHPSIEAPIGDFFGFAHGKTPPFQSAVHSIGENLGMNMWLPMPFRKNARVTLTNELPIPLMVYYQIDYTIGDVLPDDVGRLHVMFQRQNPTKLGQDIEIMPHREGKGRYIGAVIGIRPHSYEKADNWWGEGEIKMYIDGDKEFPTIAGTGAEDYVALSYGVQQTPYLYHGASWVGKDDKGTDYVSMYRWHLPDPIYWKKDIRITLQQIGCCNLPLPPIPKLLEGKGEFFWQWYMDSLYERQDDYSFTTFWYEAVPSAPLPPMPGLAARLADLPATPPIPGLTEEDADKEGRSQK